jgi:ribonuclease BN (tRNA processing enzyme)
MDMVVMNRMIFLGTGGGGRVTYTQARRSGGIYFEMENGSDATKFIIDPGPGALVFSQALGLKPENWNGVLLSHVHMDHSTDVCILLDGMKDPFLIAEKHCLKSYKDFDEYPCISKYHQKCVKNLYPVEGGEIIAIKNLKIHAAKAKHHAPCTGFKIVHDKFTIGYPADGCYYKGMEKHYENCDVIIFNVLLPKGEVFDGGIHMGVDEVITFLKNLTNKPRLAIINHLSFWMMRSNIFKQTKIIQDATKVRTTNSEDFMELDLNTLESKMHNVNVVVKK